MTDLERYVELKRTAERLRREADRASGAEEQLRKQLLDGYGCGSAKEGMAKLKKLKACLDEGERELCQAIEEFEQAWKEHLKRET